MRLLLDEGFPSPPGLNVSSLDSNVEVVPLREFDNNLAGSSTPDWYLYLVAAEAGFDALVTRDWHQSEQVEELWTLTRTDLSIVTWRSPIADSVREWGQLLAYLPEIRRMIEQNGPSIVFLPSVRLDRKNIDRASNLIGRLASELGISGKQLRDEAARTVRDELRAKGEERRFAERLG